MTENQKLREALQAISDIDDSTNHAVDASAALDRIGQIARQALALPTADHIPDAGEKVADHLPEAGKMIETAAPVCERDAFEHDLSKSPFEFDMDRWPDNAPVDWPGSYKQYHVQCAWDAWKARAAMSAGDAGWQPIETAPKDGSDCWLLVEEEVRRGFWVEIEFEERRDLDGRYIDQTDDYAYWMDKDSGDSLEPTMFYPITKPLPPAPAMRKGQL